MALHIRLPGAQLVRTRFVFLAVVAGLGAILACVPRIGQFLSVQDPLEQADGIFVLSGSFADRPLEAWDLYRAGSAPVIVLTREQPDGAQEALRRQGIAFADRCDLARDLLVRLGVPPPAIIVLPGFNDSTADEARRAGELVRTRHWHRLILVTSRLHTRRARLAFTRALRDQSVEVIVRASRYDSTDPAHYWRRRRDLRATLFEFEKFVAYSLGIGT